LKKLSLTSRCKLNLKENLVLNEKLDLKFNVPVLYRLLVLNPRYIPFIYEWVYSVNNFQSLEMRDKRKLNDFFNLSLVVLKLSLLEQTQLEDFSFEELIGFLHSS